MSKYTFRWAVAILVTIMLSLLSVIGTPPVASPPAPKASTAQPLTPNVPRRPAKLSPKEECANTLLLIDRSLGVLKAFDICEDPSRSMETWLAWKALERR
jgi:hypothetical protein